MARNTTPKRKPAAKSKAAQPKVEQPKLSENEGALMTIANWGNTIPDDFNGMNFVDDKQQIGALLGQLANRIRKVEACIASGQ